MMAAARFLVLSVVASLLAVGVPGRVLAEPESGYATPAPAPALSGSESPVAGVGIDPMPGAQLPRDAALVGSDGRSFILGEFMDGEKPLILVLAYYRCPMMCSLVISGVTNAIKRIPKTAGRDFRVLVVSFDPKDTTAVAKGKRASYLGDYGRDVDDTNFEFATGNERDVRRIADAVGFHYQWDEAHQQYVHAAGMFVVTPAGKLSQTFVGVSFEPQDVNTALDDASRGVSRSILKGALLYCFHFDPRTGKYAPTVIGIMKVGGALILLGIVAFLAGLMRWERRRKRESAEGARAIPDAPQSSQ